ncbi:MAG: hypothetical protein AABM40_04635 [Chloroflexota bacterium]
MKIDGRGRPADERDLKKVISFLSANPRATDTDIAHALSTPERRFTRSMVNARLTTLHGRGLVNQRNEVIQPELWPAYLLLQVESERRLRVDQELRKHPEKTTSLSVVGLGSETNFLVVTVASGLKSIDGLRRRCLRAGATTAYALIDHRAP